MAGTKIEINRAPVLTLWAAVVAQRCGHPADTALTLGQALAGLNAQSKGRRLGIYDQKDSKAADKTPKASETAALAAVALLGREIPVIKTPRGPRAAIGGEPIQPESVQRYLEKKFGEHLEEARLAMESLAKSLTPAQLETQGFSLYEKFRPKIPEGKKGWGAKGKLDLDLVRSLGR